MTENPIIRGFNPDPSIIRIGEDYYIATSTFEWWPGINIYHSKDLVNWVLHSRPLNTKSLLDLRGVPDGGGVWAPCLTYDGKKIYLVFTVVKERGPMMQTDNYLIEADDINGEWSDRIYLNSIGFDPSLFHDDDGRKYLISLENHYERNRRFNGLYIEEYDEDKKCLTGERRLLYREPCGELVEGAHIYKRDGYYYLLKAQGGTGVRHSAQMAKSKSLFGEWEEDSKILLHARDDETYPLQKAGHADIVAAPSGEEYLVHLASRGLFSLMGRETCIQKVCWKEGWLRLSEGGNKPYINVKLDRERIERDETVYDFSCGKDLRDFQFLRDDISDRIEFKNGLVLKGGSSLNCKFDQSLLARRIDEENVEAETVVSFFPESDRQMAGLVVIYDTYHWHYLYLTNKNGNIRAKILSCDEGLIYYDAEESTAGKDVILRAVIRDKKISFYVNGKLLECDIDATILTDEHIHLGFTGAMIGINCIDCEKRDKNAKFKKFIYRRLR